MQEIEFFLFFDWRRLSIPGFAVCKGIPMQIFRIKTAKKDRGKPRYISLKVRDINQLFNSMDPSPFVEKDLDDDAEEFIVSWAKEFPPEAPSCLRVYLEQWPAEDPKQLITTAVHNHFIHRASITELEFRSLTKQGRTSLLVGLLFLNHLVPWQRQRRCLSAATWPLAITKVCMQIKH